MNRRRLDPAHPYRKYWVCSCEEINSEEVNTCAGCGQSLISWARSMLIPVCADLPGATFAQQLEQVGHGCLNYPKVQILIMSAVEIEGSQKKAAQVFGVSPQYLNDIIRGRREISDNMARKFGLRRVVIFERLGDEQCDRCGAWIRTDEVIKSKDDTERLCQNCGGMA